MNKKLAIFSVLLSLLLVATAAYSAEELLELQAQSITQAVDTNGNPYVRIICRFDRELNGVKYSVDLPVMAFGNKTAEVDGIVEGTTFKAILQKRIYQGRESWTIVKVVK